MIIVTGAAGFIGSCIVQQLNQCGEDALILVDNLKERSDGSNQQRIELKRKNIADKKYELYYDKDEFLKLVAEDKLNQEITCLIHMGACSSTTLQDAQYFQRNNLEYTKTLAQWALKHNIRFIYASSAATYGDGSFGYKDDIETINKCKPLNLYGQSKQDFDLWVLENNLLDQVVGLKFFNVFGPNEYHKADMRSVVAKAYQGVVDEGVMRLFKSCREDYADGQQKRDFIYVKDAVDMVLFFWRHPKINGIFNVGTGQARTWNDLAHALFSAVGKEPVIEYIDLPEILKTRYQYFTQADMNQIRKAGYEKPLMSLEEAVKDYAGYLEHQTHY